VSRSNEPGSSVQLELVGNPKLSNVGADAGGTRRVVVAGNVPASELRHPEELPVATQPDSSCATAFRLLARQLEHLRNVRRIVVTSGGPGEGKSFCALNLGLALASAGAGGVLLVESSFDRPVLAERIGFTPPGCFGDWLTTAVEMPSRAFRSVGVCVPNFQVLAIDPATPNMSGLVGIGFEIAIRQLCLTRYRYIIVDGPQVTGSADCSVIADSMDGVVLCAAKGRTKLNEYRDAAKSLQPVPILAKVLLERPEP
jgi:Mrp family chromosome partitioning ATPase